MESYVCRIFALFVRREPQAPGHRGPRNEMHGFALFCISGKKLVKIRAKSRPQRPGYPGSRTIAAWGFLERCNLLLRLGKNNVFGFSWFGMIPEVIFRGCARGSNRGSYIHINLRTCRLIAPAVSYASSYASSYAARRRTRRARRHGKSLTRLGCKISFPRVAKPRATSRLLWREHLAYL